MNDRSVDGNMYFGGWPGREIRTGLSRRRGGRCSGKRVCCFFATAEHTNGWVIPGRSTTVGTFPISVVLEKDLFGGVDLGAVGTGLNELEGAFDATGALGWRRSSATVS